MQDHYFRIDCKSLQRPTGIHPAIRSSISDRQNSFDSIITGSIELFDVYLGIHISKKRHALGSRKNDYIIYINKYWSVSVCTGKLHIIVGVFCRYSYQRETEQN